MFPNTKSDLIVQSVDAQETLICDKSSGQVHLLNAVPYLVFQACRDQLSQEQAEGLFKAQGVNFNESEVAQALEKLQETGLIESTSGAGDSELTELSGKMGRRGFLQAAGAAVVVASVAMPRPAHAATGDLTILSASWGGDPATTALCDPGPGPVGAPITIVNQNFVDRTEFIQGLVDPGPPESINFPVDGPTLNAAGPVMGDPIVGSVKELIVTYQCGGTVITNERYCQTASNQPVDKTFDFTC